MVAGLDSELKVGISKSGIIRAEANEAGMLALEFKMEAKPEYSKRLVGFGIFSKYVTNQEIRENLGNLGIHMIVYDNEADQSGHYTITEDRSIKELDTYPNVTFVATELDGSLIIRIMLPYEDWKDLVLTEILQDGKAERTLKVVWGTDRLEKGIIQDFEVEPIIIKWVGMSPDEDKNVNEMKEVEVKTIAPTLSAADVIKEMEKI